MEFRSKRLESCRPASQPLNRADFVDQHIAAATCEHTQYEFSTRDTEATLATMVDDAYVNHVPVLTGHKGRNAVLVLFAGLYPEHVA